ncbi:MAG: amidohydrolase family protein [Planctomycetota bacterium]|nr:amidohydrolase family protein [Planctomycetota bacterium]
MSSMGHDERRQPHAPDVLERETLDGGFSAGWGLHQQPSETYILDCHTHMLAKKAPAILKALKGYYERAGAMRLRRHLALDGRPDRAAEFGKVSKKDDRFVWMSWIDHDQPDLKFFKKAAKLPGFCGLKLHNKKLIEQGAAPETWLSKAWDDFFDFCGEIGKPVLMHVTQRHTECPYMGGGRFSYWKVGWTKGVKYTNRDLLEVFLTQVKRHPKTTFIGAHHLHMGPEWVGRLFEEHPNLLVDLSCGNIVRFCDEMYEADRERWRNYALRWQDRILFGTDCALGGSAGYWYLWETLAAHIKFLHSLRLPQEALEKIAHANFERVAGLQPLALNGADWLFVRP